MPHHEDAALSGPDPTWVARYARGPSATTLSRAISLHQNIRALLGEGDYDTILQGSYKNGTALADMNDVDIVAIRRDVTKRSIKLFQMIAWTTIFEDIERRLENDRRYAGKWTRRDKCVTVETGICVDIVPAVAVDDLTSDPIVVHSFKANAEKKNWPRGHHENSAAKNQRTGGAFKTAVRLFKRWARTQFPETKIAPSYYLESLLYSLEDDLFRGEASSDFLRLATAIIARHGQFGGYTLKTLHRICGDGDLLSEDEWPSEAFVSFLSRLRESAAHAQTALMHQAPDHAKATWRLVFAGHEP